MRCKRCKKEYLTSILKQTIHRSENPTSDLIKCTFKYRKR